MNKLTPQEYRQKHHRCKYCKYNGGYISDKKYNRGFNWCKVKMKYKTEWILFTFLNNIQGCFCKVYFPKETNFEI